jgi:hypothetical protein
LRSRAAAPAVTALIAGCGVLNPDLDRVIGLEVEAQQLTILVGDSAQLVARAVNGVGEVVAEAVILWSIVDVDSGQIGFTLDTTTGVIAGEQAGAGRVQARIDAIRSQPILVTVVADSTGGAGARAAYPTGRPLNRQVPGTSARLALMLRARHNPVRSKPPTPTAAALPARLTPSPSSFRHLRRS